MISLTPDERAFLQTLDKIIHSNPFLPERIALEREALGAAFVDPGPVWCKQPGLALHAERQNVATLLARVRPLVERIHHDLPEDGPVTGSDANLYDVAAVYSLFERFREPAMALGRNPSPAASEFWPDFRKEVLRLRLSPAERIDDEAAHLLACFYQLRRAFDNIFQLINGQSLPAARLRGAVWESVFTHDLTRYRRGLYRRTNDVPTLIVGPTGTGKELVARSIALSRYIPFDPKTRRFTTAVDELFCPLNLSALSPTLIESELFGHSKGAFTGATVDRVGWLERCPREGTVFLDEIGELDPGIQVKLLRVLQTREFNRIGETTARPFQGKIVAATHRDLAADMEKGSFRHDFYYRLCADIVTTPSLYEQLVDTPEELSHLLKHVATRVAGDAGEQLAIDAQNWIERHLGGNYAWPGNYRELEQCVRNVMIRGSYQPPTSRAATPAAPSPERALLLATDGATLTAEELLRRYCRLVFERTGSFEAAARALDLDRRTVKAKLEI